MSVSPAAADPAPAPGGPRTATYRVQLHPGFTFDDAAAITGYLAALGVSHLYCSPYLQAVPGSTHGYDVTDHGRLNSELGGVPGHRRLTAALTAAGLRQLLDIVPNHMALAGRANAWWWDVLENGRSSRYAGYFDIDWDPPQRKLIGAVLMPVLGDHYGRVLEAGELAVERRGGSLSVRYHEHEAPLSPRSLDDLLARAAARAGSDELTRLAADLGQLPHAILADPAAGAERHAGAERVKARLARLAQAQPAVAAAIDAEIAAVNHDPDALDELLSRQNYRLAFWRAAAEELSYRRFFDIQSLAALRVEDKAVFADTHRLILALAAAGELDGLRIDHVDGLADPEGYLRRLHEAAGGVYLVAEKILEPGEQLPPSWPVAGTTGYDFLNQVSQLFTDPGGEAGLLGCYARFTGEQASYADVVHAAKLQIMAGDLAAEVERLTALLAGVCERHRRLRDYTRSDLRDALRELIASLRVYRTYPRPGQPATSADLAQVGAAVSAAGRRRPDLDPELTGFIGDLLTGTPAGPAESAFMTTFGQVSAPVMAKGAEDTAFYRYLPLASLNEVGGDPGQFGRGVDSFHQAMAAAAAGWPETMLTLSTHDTKRSGDVRARLSLLSQLPGAWELAVDRWASHNQRYKQDGWPDRVMEYLLYQTLAGAWPVSAGRAARYLAKAAREAKVHTSWTSPAAGYDAALESFVRAVLADRVFVAELETFLAEHQLVERGRVTSLAQTALLLTCPGVPDLYQGTEVWDLSLVDPDNRRPVDYPARRALLGRLAGAGPEAALAAADAGGPKIWLIHRVLAHRRAYPEACGPGSGYQPLAVSGAGAGHVVAFSRGGGLAVVVPRLLAGLGDWGDTAVTLPPGRWASVLTGEPVTSGPAQSDICRTGPADRRPEQQGWSGAGTAGRGAGTAVSVAGLLARFPVAVLRREP
ncbi:MAG TPA: malto-oligosyltrehalose synthase [Streptosporangiaceae bacterium]